jgi:hypothetical protein
VCRLLLGNINQCHKEYKLVSKPYSMNMTRRYPAGALESQTMAIRMYKCASGRSNCLIDDHAGNASKSLEPVIDTMRKLVHVALKPLDALGKKKR